MTPRERAEQVAEQLQGTSLEVDLIERAIVEAVEEERKACILDALRAAEINGEPILGAVVVHAIRARKP